MSPHPLSARRAVVLCADDYALAPGIGQAIRALLQKGRISATSCMTLAPDWPQEAALLKPFDGRADIGLHFTLTGLKPLGPMPRLAPRGRLPGLGRLIALSLMRGLDPAEIAAELDRQLDAFEAHFGRPPDFIDGHQHVHQFPGIGPVVLDALRRRLKAGYVRYAVEPWGAILRRRVAVGRALLIAGLGRGFARRGRRLGVPGNASFRGVHDFSGRPGLATLFGRFLEPAADGVLIMCHPGLVDETLRRSDPLTTPREAEFAFLQGEVWPQMLAQRGLRVGRMAEALQDAARDGAGKA